MLPIQAINGSTSKHAFSFDWGRTTTGTHYLTRAGKEYPQQVIVEPGTRNIYIGGYRYTQPSEETTPGGASENHWAQRAFLLKLDQQGNVLWNRELSKDGEHNNATTNNRWRRYEEFNGICLHPTTGDIHCVGYTDSQYPDNYNWARLSGDCLVAKYNSSGTLQYQKFYGRDKTDAGQSVEWFPLEEEYDDCFSLSDGKFVASGGTWNHPGSNSLVYTSGVNRNRLLTCWNTNGTVSWSKWISVGGTQNNDSTNVNNTYGNLGGVDSSNNVYSLITSTGSPGGTRGAFILKFNSSGTLQWQKNIPLSFTINSYTQIWSGLHATKSGDLYLKSPTATDGDDAILKLNSSGTVQWLKSFDGTGKNLYSLQTDEEENLWFHDGAGNAYCVDSSGTPIRNVTITSNTAYWGFYSDFTVDEGYITMICRGRILGTQTSSSREETLGVLRAEISGVNNGSYTHTNANGSTLTVTVSTPSTGSVTNHSNPSVSNSSVSVINYAGNTSTRLNNGSCTNFTNSSPPYGKTLTV